MLKIMQMSILFYFFILKRERVKITKQNRAETLTKIGPVSTVIAPEAPACFQVLLTQLTVSCLASASASSMVRPNLALESF